MEEQKTKTYGDLKCRKAELRNEMDEGDLSNIDEYRYLLQRIRQVESFLLWGVVCLILFVAVGCQTFRGAKADVHWLTQPEQQIEK